MKEAQILKLVKNRVINKQITKANFDFLFSSFDKAAIAKILADNNIAIVDKIIDNSVKQKNTDNPQQLSFGYKNYLLKLSNENLCVLYKKDKRIGDILIKKNQRMIWKFVKQLTKSFKYHHLNEDDFYIHACIGMLKAAKRYIKSKHAKYSTYCWHWVRSLVNRAFSNEELLIRLPVHVYEKISKVQKYRYNNPWLNQSELIDLISSNESENNWKNEDIKKYIRLTGELFNTKSLNEIVSKDEISELIDFIPDKRPTTEDICINKLSCEYISKVLSSKLKNKEVDIINKRFGLENEVPKSLEEIGTIYNVTRERIRQIEAKSLRRLRHRENSKLLREFYE